MLMTATTVVQVSQDLFYVLLQLLVVAAIILSFKFYCKFYYMFYFTCDRSLTDRRRSIDGRRYFRFLVALATRRRR